VTPVTYSVGMSAPSNQPVILIFQNAGTKQKVTTSWSIEDAEMMAHALMRNAERARRYMAEHPPQIIMPK
jgi:hypothetical protein